MLHADQFVGAPLFSGGAFLPSQSMDSSISPSKVSSLYLHPASLCQFSDDFEPFILIHDFRSQIRTPQTLIPMTVKQIIEVYHSSEDKPAIMVDGVRFVGLVMNKMERETEVSFTLDDGTGRIDIRRWANESSDTSDSAFIQPLTDFNDIALHFVECIYVHLRQIRGDNAQMQMNINISTPFSNGKEYLAPFPNQFLAHSSMGGSRKDVCSLVLGMFEEPSMLSASEHGLHVDELFRRLDLPKNQIMDAISYLVDVGHIYSTVDEYHFKPANNCTY